LSSLQKASKYELLDPDVRLMLQVRQGNAAAFESLVEKHQRKLVMVLEHMVRDRAHAEDLAQDVFLRVYRARERYVPTAKFSTWLYTITHNVASNWIRKSSRRKEVNLVSSPSGSMPVRPLDTMAKDKSTLMPARLADQEGMSYSEIAEAMELTTQAVKSLLSRARGNLKEALDPYLKSGRLPKSLDIDEDSSGKTASKR